MTGKLALAVLLLGAACMPDNSVGADVVTGRGGAGAAGGQGGVTAAGSGGTAAGGSGGSGGAGGSGGVVDAGSGAGGSGGVVVIDGGAGGASAGGSGGGAGGRGGAGGGGGPIVIMAGGASKCAAGASTATIGKLCDGFEDAAPGTAGSAFVYDLAGGSTGVVDTTRPYRGAKSVHIKTGGKGYITEKATFNQSGTVATNNEMWGRIFIYFTQTGMPNSHDVFITLEDPASTLQAAEYHVAGGSRGLLNSGIRFDNPAGDHYQPPMGTGTVSYVKDPVAWHCWEWHTTAANTSDFYIDGAPYAMMTVTAAMKWPLPVFKSMSLGFMEFSATPATELWIDEVAVDTARIGCDN